MGIRQDIQEMFSSALEAVRNVVGDFIEFAREAWLVLIVLLGVAMTAWWYADPPPADHIYMATGRPGGSYNELGKKYAEYFEKRGIKLELIETTGAVDNLELIAGGGKKVQAAFVQAGTFDPAKLQGLYSLGAIEYIPIWFFYRGPERKEIDLETVDGHLKYFPNFKISIGQPGGGTFAHSTHILKIAGANIEDPQFVRMKVRESVEALKNGSIDALFIADSTTAVNVRDLLENNNPQVHLGSIAYAPGFAKITRYFQLLNIPTGGVRMAPKFPSADVRMLATTTHLIVDENLNPSLQYLFIAAATEINGRPNFFAHRNEFPNFRDSGIPESPVFERYEKHGQPWLMTYFPFWLAELIDRLAILVVPFLAVAFPLFSSLPSFKIKLANTRIHRIYGTLKAFEKELSQGYDPAKREEYLQKLDYLEYQTLRINVPKGMSNDYYALRTNINYVRDCLNRGDRPYKFDDMDAQNG